MKKKSSGAVMKVTWCGYKGHYIEEQIKAQPVDLLHLNNHQRKMKGGDVRTTWLSSRAARS